MKAAFARHRGSWVVATGGFGKPQGRLNAGRKEAGGDAGNNPGVLAEGPWAGREGGVRLRLLADEGGVSSAPVSNVLPIVTEKESDCGRVYSILWLMVDVKEEVVI